jgi:hypothetical protein
MGQAGESALEIVPVDHLQMWQRLVALGFVVRPDLPTIPRTLVSDNLPPFAGEKTAGSAMVSFPLPGIECVILLSFGLLSTC